MTIFQNRGAMRGGVGLAMSICLFAGPAYGQASNSYLGITSGGPIDAPDRIASDDIATVTSSAQISSADDTVSANFSLNATMVSNRKITTVRVGQDERQFVSAYTTNISVKASLPLNGASNNSLVDFKTFGNNGKLTIGFNSYHAKFISPFDTLPELSLMARGCIVEAGVQWRKKDRANNPAEIDTVLAAYNADLQVHGAISGALDVASKTTRDDGFGPYTKKYCRVASDNVKTDDSAGVTNDNEYVIFGKQAIGPERASAFRRRYFDPQTTFFWGGELSLGYNRFSVAQRSTLSVQTVDRVGFDGNARAGWILGNAGTMVTFSAGYTRSYDAKDEVDVCGPTDALGNSICIHGQDGVPDRKSTGYGSASLRLVVLSNSSGQPIVGIRPSVTYVLEDKDWQFELPVYLQRSDAGGLDAGVKAIYNTGTDKVGLGAFVGVTF